MSTSVVIYRCETVYFMIRQNLLHRMKEVCGATSCMMDKLIVVQHQVLNIYYIHRCCRVLFCKKKKKIVSIIGCNNYLYSVILNSFLYLHNSAL